MSLMLKQDWEQFNLCMLSASFWGGESCWNCKVLLVRAEYLFIRVCIFSGVLQKRREKRGENKIDKNLQHSQMSQSCEIRLGDFSEVVCIQIPGQRKRGKKGHLVHEI